MGVDLFEFVAFVLSGEVINVVLIVVCLDLFQACKHFVTVDLGQ